MPLSSREFSQDVVLASETFQRTGSFKFRGAWHLAQSVPQTQLVASSSGNFGQGLAYACRLLGKRCTVIMPNDATQVKIDGIRSHGAVVELINVSETSRSRRQEEIAAESGDAYVASPFDDDLVIAGNATLGHELARLDEIDTVIVPIGGGGLAAGVICGLRAQGSRIEVFGSEPLLANDAARSLRAGTLVSNDAEPETIADGARALRLGERNWTIIRGGLGGIVEVSEAQIGEALRLLFYRANLKAEPTGALAVGALLAAPDLFKTRKVCCVVSGGNVDGSTYARLLAAGDSQ